MKKLLPDLTAALALLVCLMARNHGMLLSIWLLLILMWLRTRPALRLEFVLFFFLLTITCCADLLAPFDAMGRAQGADLLGLDALGRDHFSRLLLGNRNSVLIASVGSVLALMVGTLMSALLALSSGWLHFILKTFLQCWLSIPAIIYLYLGLALSDSGGALTLIVLFGLTLWPESARLLEARIDELKQADFVSVARMGGRGETAIFFYEILPNLRAVWTVNLLVTFISAVLLEAVVGFLGLGLSVGTPSLGHLIEVGARQMDRQPLVLFAAIGLLMTWIFTMRSLLKRLGTSNPALLVP